MKLLKVEQGSVHSHLNSSPSSSFPHNQSNNDMNRLDMSAAHLIFSYLTHHCYPETAAAFTAQWIGADKCAEALSNASQEGNTIHLMKLGLNVQDKLFSKAITGGCILTEEEKFAAHTLEYRLQLRNMIIDGKIMDAIKYIDEYFPQIFMTGHAIHGGITTTTTTAAAATAITATSLPTIPESTMTSSAMEVDESSTSMSTLTPTLSSIGNTNTTMTLWNGTWLRFRLLCQHFIEMVKGGDSTGALEFTESALTPLAQSNPRFMAHLQEVVVLLAYANPAESPVQHLLALRNRKELADHVNAAILSIYLSFFSFLFFISLLTFIHLLSINFVLYYFIFRTT